MPYEVFYDENGSYMDEGTRSRRGVYNTAEAALAVCRAMVDADLEEVHEPGCGAGMLLARWRSWGRDPFIVTTSNSEPLTFSAWTYAEEQCKAAFADAMLPKQNEADKRG